MPKPVSSFHVRCGIFVPADQIFQSSLYSLAYEVAKRNCNKGGNNKIILTTDGIDPVNKHTIGVAAVMADDQYVPIQISVIHFGRRQGSRRNLENLTQAGNGTYFNAYENELEESLMQEILQK